MSGAIQVDGTNFKQEVLAHPGLVLVDFWAEWCGPCRMLTPIINDLSGEYQGKVKIVGLDVDKSQDIAGQYGIQAIPTLLLFKNGAVAEQLVGLQTKENLRKKLDQHLQQ